MIFFPSVYQLPIRDGLALSIFLVLPTMILHFWLPSYFSLSSVDNEITLRALMTSQYICCQPMNLWIWMRTFRNPARRNKEAMAARVWVWMENFAEFVATWDRCGGSSARFGLVRTSGSRLFSESIYNILSHGCCTDFDEVGLD